ncbi:MAG: T9SS type A sorting domain-containing protein [Proteobacteria bacterium]|nr:T9SS type A sorting domain-containing protein [Pseudomonadota bacterium]
MRKLICLLLFIGIYTCGNSQCFEDRHNTSYTDAWISCQKKINPNPERPISHWVRYDFGHLYSLGQMHIWNCNVANQLNMAIKTCAIDYSEDGINWTEWGVIELSQPEASGFYEGDPGPDFDGLKARYLLLTVLENYGANCASLSEIRIETSGLATSTYDHEILGLELNVRPNPASDIATIIVSSDENFDARFELHDLKGREINSGNVNVFQGENTIPLSVAHLSNGNYIFSIFKDNRKSSIQITIINN